MKRTRLMGRGLVYLAAILIALWILIPIYLITIAAFSPRDVIYSWPKALFPQAISLETMRFFLNSYKVLDSVRNSAIVALLALVVSLVIGAPAGYGLARYVFRGQDVYRVMILSTRAFPLVILSIPLGVTFRQWGLYDSLISVALIHVAMALPTTILVTSSVCYFHLRALVERGLRRHHPDPFQPHAACPADRTVGCIARCLSLRRRLLHSDPRHRVHVLHPPLPV
jgi:multiple sugar transport system permease protein